ncbi:MAG TPA: tyrosine--tRNA ligase [Candidatus Paceibacterota bacterium]|nr:tyrosine--tRNA ligase [Verrucomicrobiota bacterium]HRY48327.1 tyrosine--tRNA ligase [Candidatus Paceibacterota bacterium]HRZ99903.1 tyrosine--tRNA ligase [Candidatus Paceibacterota bacterium]
MSIIDELHWRGLIADCTDREGLSQRLAGGPTTLYCGFDPTADSLHVGNLIPLLTLRRFQQWGHCPIALAGGATGLIGDPSGKKAERQLLTREILETNIASVKEQLRRLLDFDTAKNPARLLDNASWIAPISFLDFLRDVGKHFSVNVMVAKESVRARMEDRESGISYTEFSYMLLQAYDFFHLRNTQQCELQIGGSDQWGNITAGIDLIRRKLELGAFGLTLPLLTNPDGTKFGKSVTGAVWLDPRKTSIYRFYQFWIRSDDRQVVKLLKLFSFLPAEEIDHLDALNAQKPESRDAHKALAKAMTSLIHGESATADAIRASEILFGGGLEGVSESTFNDVVGEVPSKNLDKIQLDGAGMSLIDVLVFSGLSASKGQARKDVEGGGIYLNNVRESDLHRQITAGDLLFGKHLLLRKGKRNYVVVTAR